MNVALWIIAGLLALVFLAAGLMKLTQPKPKLAAAGMGWAEGMHGGAIKTIGALELLAAIGLVLPAALGIAQVLTPLAAVGIALIMIGAVVTHAMRAELPMIIGNVVLLLLATLVAWGRFGPYSF